MRERRSVTDGQPNYMEQIASIAGLLALVISVSAFLVFALDLRALAVFVIGAGVLMLFSIVAYLIDKDRIRPISEPRPRAVIRTNAFLVFWGIIQWLASEMFGTLKLSGIDRWVLSALQVLFAVSTLVSTIVIRLVDIYNDMKSMILRARRRVPREVELTEVDDSSDK